MDVLSQDSSYCLVVFGFCLFVLVLFFKETRQSQLEDPGDKSSSKGAVKLKHCSQKGNKTT